MKLKELEGILFLSYITDYNIGEIHKAFQYDDHSDFINDYISFKAETKRYINQENVDNALITAKIAGERLNYLNISTISIFDPLYPPSLKALSAPPPILYVKGKLKIKKCAAIVGSRSISKFALEGVSKAVELFVAHKFGIVSGLAFGIDTLAHEITLQKKGYAIAVMPNSLETIYPQTNYKLANSILNSGGALISEIPLGINRGRRSFVERDRIQAALSEIVVPIEMKTDSGTMHTIKFAYQQNKKVLLIKPHNKKASLLEYEGINYLINSKKENANSIIVDDTYSWKLIQKSLKNKNQIKIHFE